MLDYKLFKENGISLRSIKKLNNAYLISDGETQYVVKAKNSNLSSKYEYLLSRNFNYFPNYFSIGNYNVYEYIENKNISDEERLNDVVKLISLLHTKTTRYQTIDIDDHKIIYEKLDKRIKYLENYYIALNDSIDNEIYMSPSHYLLVLNISKIYSALSFCRLELDNWYDLIKNSKKQRKVFIHNNLELDHLLFNKNPYLISWDNSKVDLPIYDLINLYEKYYKTTDFTDLINNYEERYPLNKQELKLFYIMISIPKKIEFTNDEFKNTKRVKDLIEYLKTSDSIIRPNYKKINS